MKAGRDSYITFGRVGRYECTCISTITDMLLASITF